MGGIVIVLLGLYIWNNQSSSQSASDLNNERPSVVQENDENITPGTEKYRNFVLDNVFHSKDNGDIHYNVYIPDSYDGKEPYALYFTLPGYQGLYFQGVGEISKQKNLDLLHKNIKKR